MVTDKKLETMEEELKLLKGELKNSLASVRDYLLNMELPSSEFATVLAALGVEGGTQNITMKGSLSTPSDSGSRKEPKEEAEEPTTEETIEEFLEEPEPELAPEEKDLRDPEEPFRSESELAPEDELINQDENPEPEAGLSPEEEIDKPDKDKSLMPDSDLPIEEELPMDHERTTAEVSQSTPKVNLLANLINWVAKAKKDIGYEQMPTFLEVYGISGHLSSELKEAILHLAEITSEQPEDTNKAEVWSQAMLSLHGILTGGDAPLNPVKPNWNDDVNETQPEEDEVLETAVNKRKDTPVKLKLVFPNGDNKTKEFCINLTPETDNNGS